MADTAVDCATDDEVRIWRSAMIGSAVGFAVMTTGIAIAGTLGGIGNGIGAASSLGLGAFVGSFGGAGFGFMLGASIPLARQLDAGQPARSTTHGQPPRRP